MAWCCQAASAGILSALTAQRCKGPAYRLAAWFAGVCSGHQQLLTQDGWLQGEAEGILCIKQAWPSMFRTLFNAQERFEEAYFSSFKASL